MKNIRLFFSITLCLMAVSGLFAQSEPTVFTSTIDDVALTSATCGGEVSDNGGAEVIARGVCWNLWGSPTIDDSHTTDGEGVGTFTSSITDLTPNTTYYVRAYATNEMGTAYGEQILLRTLPNGPLVVDYGLVIIQNSLAITELNIGIEDDLNTFLYIENYGPDVPAYSDTVFIDISLEGDVIDTVYRMGAEFIWMTDGSLFFISDISFTASQLDEYGLDGTFEMCCTVRFKGIAIDPDASNNTACLTINRGALPSVTTALVTVTGANTATCGGEVTDEGTSGITARGVCWSTLMYPTVSDSRTENGTGVGTFTSMLTRLDQATRYFVRAYATNESGTNYGEQVVFQIECSESGVVVTDENLYHEGFNQSSDFGCWTTEILYGSNDWTPSHSDAAEGYYSAYLKWNHSMSSLISPVFDLTQCTLPTLSFQYKLPEYQGYQGSELHIYYRTSETDAWEQLAAYTPSSGPEHTALYNEEFTFDEMRLPNPTATYQICFKGEGDYGTVFIDDVNIGTGASCLRPFNVTIVDSHISPTSVALQWTERNNETPANGWTIWVNGEEVAALTNPYTLTGLTPATDYTVKVKANCSTEDGSEWSASVTFSTPGENDAQPCSGHETVTDADGNVYNTVSIGNQCWLKENLRTTRFANGTPISQGMDTSTTIAYFYYPNGDADNADIYGLLYNWPAAMKNSNGSEANPSGLQGICPNGWHVPSVDEWLQLADYVNSQSEYRCNYYDWYDYHDNNFEITKALAGTTGWNNNDDTPCSPGYDPNTNNQTGFSALPAGWSDGNEYYNFGDHAIHWCTSTRYFDRDETYQAWGVFSDMSIALYGIVVEGFIGRAVSFPVRCVLGAGLPTVTTSPVTDITTTSATCGGNVTDDGGAEVTARGVCWSTSQNPTVSDSHTEDGTGTGTFTSAITGLTPNTTYYVRAYATNEAGTVYGEEVSFTTSCAVVEDEFSCPGITSVSDIDGNVYNTVQIGEQCWMRENMRTLHYANGSPVLPEPMAYPGTNANTYGYLYTYEAATNYPVTRANPAQKQGICPNGWHIPTDDDFVYLMSHYENTGDLMSSDNWITTGDNNNSTGFNLEPTGLYNSELNRFEYLYVESYLWSYTPESTVFHACQFGTACSTIEVIPASATNGYGVRCIKD